MKTIFACTLFFLFFTTPGWSRTDASRVRGADTTRATQQKVVVQVDGLACPFCAYGLEKKLKRMEGLRKLEIQINTGQVLLWFEPDARVDVQAIVKKIKEAGFTAREISVNGKPVTGTLKPRREKQTEEGLPE